MYKYFFLFNIFIFSHFFSINLYPQIGSIISSERRVSWTTAGYENDPSDNIPISFYAEYPLPQPSINPDTNSLNIKSAINWAREHNQNGPVCIQFQDGIYNINQSIVLGGCCLSNIVLQGKGPDKTTINYVGNSNATNAVIRGGGYLSIPNYILVRNYNHQDNSITVSTIPSFLHVNDYIVIKMANGPWQDDSTDIVHNWPDGPARDYLGQINKIKVIDKPNNILILEDDFSLTWDIMQSAYLYKEKYSPAYLQKLAADTSYKSNAVSNIGVMDLKITSNGAVSSLGGHITFDKVVNCWVKNVESYKPYRVHIGINSSYSVEIRESYFHEASSYGANGFGYGIAITNASTNNLVIDNIFSVLRHAIMMQGGPNKNVIAYNYSRIETHPGNYYEGDFELHGHYPFANLFEGNIVDHIFADNYWGYNGPYNTFVRNYGFYHYCRIENSNSFNFVGNEFLLTVDNSSNLFDVYGYLNSDSLQVYQTVYDTLMAEHVYLPDISYIFSSRPDFISTEIFTWPPIGPPVTSNKRTTQNIPARKRLKN